MDITVRDATQDDLGAIMDIYNDAVVNTTAIWNETVVDLENRRDWFAARRSRGFPVLVALKEGQVCGYASYGDWRAFEGYRHTVEHSIYVRKDARGEGIGRLLMQALMAHAKNAGMHVMIAAIEAENTASIRLHESLGFRIAGRFSQVGTKFGRWLDLTCMERLLP